MHQKSILIFSSLAEPCTQKVVEEIIKLGASANVVFFEEAALTTNWAFQLDSRSDINRLSIKSKIDVIRTGNLDEYNSVWFRRWGYPAMPRSFSQRDVAFAYGEFTALLAGIASCSNAKWVNSLESERRASNKIHQLNVARRLGATIPETLVTNNAEEVLRFKQSYGEVIFKPVSGATINHYSHSKAAVEALNRLLKYPATKFTPQWRDALSA